MMDTEFEAKVQHKMELMRLKGRSIKGDVPGHEFHGNQYTGSGGANSHLYPNQYTTLQVGVASTVDVPHTEAGHLAMAEEHRTMANEHRFAAKQHPRKAQQHTEAMRAHGQASTAHLEAANDPGGSKTSHAFAATAKANDMSNELGAHGAGYGLPSHMPRATDE